VILSHVQRFPIGAWQSGRLRGQDSEDSAGGRCGEQETQAARPGLGITRGEGCQIDIRMDPRQLSAGGYQVLEGILFEPPQLREG
jgi:hypothetical protein